MDGFVRRLRAHSALADVDEQAIVSLPFKLATLRPNAQPVREGDATSSVMVLVSGCLLRFRLTEEGGRQITAIYVPGDPVDLEHLYLPVADDSLQALRQCVVARIQQQDLRALLARRPSVAEVVLRTLLVDASISREWTLNLGRRDARARIAHLFAELAVRLQYQGVSLDEGVLPLTQDQIADATGLTPVHVNRTLKALRGEGAIERGRGGLVTVSNLDLLRAAAGFDARYLHHDQ